MSLKHKGEAYAELLRRYGAIFRHHWQNRHTLGGGLLNAQEADFLPPALSLQEKPISPASRLLGRTLMALVVMSILWSIFGKVDIVVNAEGKIIPSARTKTIGSVDVASVKALHVEEGKSVKAGDLLVELDTSAPDAEHDKAASEHALALLQAARSKALIEAVDRLQPPRLPPVEGVPQDKWLAAQRHLDGQYRDFLAKLHRIEGDVQRYQQALPLAAQRAYDYRELAQDHDVSTHAYLEKEQARVDLEGQLNDARHQREALIEETRRQAYDALTEGTRLAG